MTPRENAERWLAEARENLASARDLLGTKRYGLCVYHCQQTGEIALKAVLYSLGQRPFGHSLRNLLASIVEIKGLEPDALLEESTDILDAFYISGRYPDVYEDTIPSRHFTKEQAEGAIEWAEQFLLFATTNVD